LEKKNKISIIEKKFNRKIVKKFFMPLIYGKKLNTMANDIREHYDDYFSAKDSNLFAKICNNFFKENYSDIINLLNIINLVAWFCSKTKMNRAVLYSVPFFTTMQDYMCSDKINMWLYEKVSQPGGSKGRKRHMVTVNIPTFKRDSRKSLNSTCANFIHQKDAYIAMNVVKKLVNDKKRKGHIYTVHDNLITTLPFVEEVPYIYTGVFMEMGSPLIIINDYIYMNLIEPYIDEDWFIEAFPNYVYEEYKPIPHDLFKDILNKSIENLNNKSRTKKNSLFNKIENLVTYYKTYVSGVCNEIESEDPLVLYSAHN